MTIEIISWSIATKVWDRARMKFMTPGSAVRHASVDRHVPQTHIFRQTRYRLHYKAWSEGQAFSHDTSVTSLVFIVQNDS